jgi:hypothetical protein
MCAATSGGILDRRNDLAKQLPESLLANVGVVTIAVMVRAVVVDVLAFLPFRRDGAAAFRAC